MSSRVWTPWGFLPIPDRTIRVAQPSQLGGSVVCASPILSAGSAGLVAHCDGHTVAKKEMSCPTEDVSKSTQVMAEAS